MKKIILGVSLGLLMVAHAEASRGRQPCSGAKGGISYCTSSGQFMCNDGTLSRSQTICSGYGSGGEPKKNSSVPKVKTVQKQKMSKMAPSVMSSVGSQPDKTEPRKPTCAPLYMATKPGFTNLPICSDNQY